MAFLSEANLDLDFLLGWVVRFLWSKLQPPWGREPKQEKQVCILVESGLQLDKAEYNHTAKRQSQAALRQNQVANKQDPVAILH